MMPPLVYKLQKGKLQKLPPAFTHEMLNEHFLNPWMDKCL